MSRYHEILGLGEYQPKTEYICFLPWVSEFGWYIMNHVKRFHGYNHHKKIACIRRGHECLFPTAAGFFYDWKDTLPESKKAGVAQYSLKEELMEKIREQYGDSITFIDPGDTSWKEKTSLAHLTFIPKPLNNFELKTDVVITPRLRSVERTRNYRHWQGIVNSCVNAGWKVGVCGLKDQSFDLKNITHKAYDHVDVDSDVEMMLKTRIVVTQDTGLAYLAMMCKKPLIILDKPVLEVMNAHRDKSIYFKVMPFAWNNLEQFIGVMKVIMTHYK